MNRNLYASAIFWMILLTIAGFIQSIIYFQLGRQLYSLESIVPWYVCFHVISVISTLILLKYYYYKEYVFAFRAAILATAAGLFQVIIEYTLLAGYRELANLLYPAVLLTLGTAIVYAIGLVFSGAGQRPWLKAAGISTFILAITLIVTIIWSISPQDIQKNAVVEKIHQWISIPGSLIPLLFAMNFRSERSMIRKVNIDSPLPPQRSLESLMVLSGLLAGVAILVFTSKLTNETISKVSWEKQLSIKAKEWAKLFEGRTFTGISGDTLRYQLLKPLNFDPQKKYPLVVCLPYGGGVEGCPAAQVLLTDFNRTKYPSFLFVPTCPPGAGWGGIPNYPTIDSLVFEAIHALEKAHKEIDTNRRYVTGVSRGGYGSWHFITTRPDMFAAAIPVCGGGDPALAHNVVEVSVWAFHGENDRNVPVSGSRDMIEAIKSAGGDPLYTEFRGEGHNIWDQVKATQGLWDWFFEQKRD